MWSPTGCAIASLWHKYTFYIPHKVTAGRKVRRDSFLGGGEDLRGPMAAFTLWRQLFPAGLFGWLFNLFFTRYGPESLILFSLIVYFF